MVSIDDNMNIYLTRGDTITFDVELTDEDENPYIMSADEVIVFTVRKIPGKNTALITKVNNTPEISLTTDDTKLLTFGDYKYDILIYNEVTEELQTFIADKIFTIGEEVHDFE